MAVSSRDAQRGRRVLASALWVHVFLFALCPTRRPAPGPRGALALRTRALHHDKAKLRSLEHLLYTLTPEYIRDTYAHADAHNPDT